MKNMNPKPEDIRLTFLYNGHPQYHMEPFSLSKLANWTKNGQGKPKTFSEAMILALLANKYKGKGSGGPGFLYGGRFADGKLEHYSGLICIGFDASIHGDFSRVDGVVKKDPHTLLAFLGQGGKRYYVFFRVNSGVDHHVMATRKAAAYFIEEYGLCPTTLPKSHRTYINIARDPECYFNSEAKVFNIGGMEEPAKVEDVTPQASDPAIHSQPDAVERTVKPEELIEGIQLYLERKERIDALLGLIDEVEPLLSLSKLERLNLGWGLVKGFGRSGRELYHQFCQWGYGYDPGDIEVEFDLCLQAKDHGQDEHTVFAYLEGVIARLEKEQESIPIEPVEVVVPERSIEEALPPEVLEPVDRKESIDSKELVPSTFEYPRLKNSMYDAQLSFGCYQLPEIGVNGIKVQPDSELIHGWEWEPIARSFDSGLNAKWRGKICPAPGCNFESFPPEKQDPIEEDRGPPNKRPK